MCVCTSGICLVYNFYSSFNQPKNAIKTLNSFSFLFSSSSSASLKKSFYTHFFVCEEQQVYNSVVGEEGER